MYKIRPWIKSQQVCILVSEILLDVQTLMTLGYLLRPFTLGLYPSIETGEFKASAHKNVSSQEPNNVLHNIYVLD